MLPEARVVSSELRLELEAVEDLAEVVVEILEAEEEEDLGAGAEDKHQDLQCHHMTL